MEILTIIFVAPVVLLFVLAARDGIKVWKEASSSKRVGLEEVLFDDKTPWYESDDQNDAKKSS